MHPQGGSPQPPSVPALQLEHVWLSFDGATVLEDISLTLPEGEFLGLIGPNGGGKTVLLRVLTGLLPPDRGRVEIFGRRPEKARGLIGYVPQYPRFDSRFPIRVRDVVLMGRLGRRRFFRGWRAEDRDRATEALARMEIESLAGRQVGDLSGGQLQRVLIARALATRSRILVLDEPTASLDTRIGTGFYEKLQQLSREMTIILVSHDIAVLNRYVSVVACLNRRLHYHGTKQITREMIEATYGCPVDFIVHAHSHRVMAEHRGNGG